MADAFVDTSVLLAIAFAEPGAEALARRLRRMDHRFASGLLEAEYRSARLREGLAEDAAALASLSWVMPSRPLSAEVAQVLGAGYVRGADCWHLATALFLDPTVRSLTFLTLDGRQRAVARRLGFKT